MADKKQIKYFVVDTLAESAFKGFPVDVCFLEDDNERDDAWLQSLAAEFNFSETCFLTPITVSDSHDFPPFRLRWFTPAVEVVYLLVDLCGHATLASAHVLFSNSLINSETVEIHTRSGILTAKRVPLTSELKDCVEKSIFLIELNLPVVPTCEFNSVDDHSEFSKALNGATIIDVKATKTDILPIKDEILKFPFQGMIVTAAASAGSRYDFCSRYYASQVGIDEETVTGSAHCALAHYWSSKMNKSDFKTYQVSSRACRGGRLNVHFDKENQRVVLRGKAITVLEGHVLV